MNSHPADSPTVTRAVDYLAKRLRAMALVVLLGITAGLSSGCARMTQYSVDSWMGPMPMHDIRYVRATAPPT